MLDDEQLKSWRDAVVAGDLPGPIRADRWQALRAGVVNLWEFETTEYWYADGWVQLMGSNETGKSSLMALTTLIPWLADVASSNIDTLGRSGKTFRYYVEPTGRDADRREATASTHHGWLWVEYGRRTDQGEEFFTTLLFAEARGAAADMRLHWCTLSGGERVRGGCDLLAARRVVLPKDVTAEGFTRHPSAAAYRREVASRLLGSTAEKLEAVGKLLRVTRTPKLGEQLQVRFISDRLHDALPELDRSEINQLADGWDQLDEIRADLDRAADAVEIVEGFTVRSWRPWVRAVLRRAADRGRSAITAFDNVTRREREARRELGEADARRAVVEEERRSLELAGEGARVAAEELRASSRYQDAQGRLTRLTHARTVAEMAGRESAEANRRAEAADAAARRAEETRETAEAALETRRRETSERLADARYAAREAGVDIADFDPVLTEQRVGDRQRDVKRAQQFLGEVVLADQEASRAEDVAAESRQRATEAGERRDAAWDVAEQERDSLAAGLDVWAEKVGGGVDVEAWQSALPDGSTPQRPLRERIREEWFEPTRAPVQVRLRESELQGRLARERVGELDGRIEELDRAGVADPQPPALWVRRSRPDTGAPVWRLVNPREGLQEQELAAIEAALAASGLLDAWVSDEGVVADDVLAVVEEPVERGLGEVLEAASGPWNERVEALLAGVHLVHTGEELPGTGLAIALDGRWRNGSMVGRASCPNGNAEHLGEEAREAGRARRRAELNRAREEALAEATEHEAEASWASAELAALQRAMASAPDDRELFGLLRDAATAETLAAAAEETAAQHEARARGLRAEADARRATLLTFATQHHLPVREAELVEVQDALRRTENALGVLRHAREREELALGACEAAVTAATEGDRQRDEAITKARAAEERLGSATSRVQALEKAIGSDDQEIVRELEELQARAAEVASQATGLGRELLRLAGRVGKAEEALAAAERERETVTAERDRAFAWFRRLVDAGLAEELGLELPEPDSTAIMQVRAQVRFVSQQVTIRNWNEDPDQADQAVQNAWRRLHTGAGEARGALEAGGRSLRIDEVDDLPRVTVVVDAHGAGHPLTEALARLRAIQEELALNYDQRVQDTLGQLLGSTFMDHLRDRIGATQALVGRINKVLEAHATRTDRTALRIVLEPKDAATRQVLEAVGGPAWGNPEVEERVREFLRVRVDEVKREAQGAGLADWRNGLAERLDYRSWYDIHLEHRRGSGKWGPLTSRGYAELSGGARVVMLMMPLVATLAAMYEEMPTGPRPLWLDEAFDGLDAANRATVMKLFREFDLDVLLVGPGRIVNVAAVPVAAIYQVVRAPAPMPGADLVLELWAGGQLETIETPALGASERQDQLL